MTLSKELEREHVEIDQWIDSFISDSGVATAEAGALVTALDHLRRHIYFEEEFLFPPLRQAGLVPPLFVMCREHGGIWATMSALSSALGSGADRALLAGLVDRLMVLLQEHNMKEETIVYPAADRMLAAPDLEELETSLAVVRRPAEWVCEAAR